MKKWTTEHGTLVMADCIEHMKSMKPNSVDLVFGSPPYEDARTYSIGFDLKGQAWVDWMVEIYKQSLRVSRGLACFVVGHGRNGTSRWTAAPALLIADLYRSGIRLRNPVLYKRMGVPGSGCQEWFRADYEWVVCASKVKNLHWANNTATGHKPVGSKPGKRFPKLTNKKKDGTREVRNRSRPLVTTNPGNIVECGQGRHLGSTIAHEGDAPFPERLPNFFIRSFVPPGGTVYDPFGGTGTTLAAAIKCGRRFISCDIRESQIKLMQRRVRQAELNTGWGF